MPVFNAAMRFSASQKNLRFWQQIYNGSRHSVETISTFQLRLVERKATAVASVTGDDRSLKIPNALLQTPCRE